MNKVAIIQRLYPLWANAFSFLIKIDGIFCKLLPFYRTEVPDWDKPDGSATKSQSPDQVPEVSLRDKLGNAATLDVEASDISWDTLFSLHHTKYTSSNEHSEDELNKALEVCYLQDLRCY